MLNFVDIVDSEGNLPKDGELGMLYIVKHVPVSKISSGWLLEHKDEYDLYKCTTSADEAYSALGVHSTIYTKVDPNDYL